MMLDPWDPIHRGPYYVLCLKNKKLLIGYFVQKFEIFTLDITDFPFFYATECIYFPKKKFVLFFQFFRKVCPDIMPVDLLEIPYCEHYIKVIPDTFTRLFLRIATMKTHGSVNPGLPTLMRSKVA